MTLPDGPGWSPDGGEYWVKNDVMYWHDGDVTRLERGIAVRTMPIDHGHDYSAWNDEKRAEVAEEWRLKRLAYGDQRKARERDVERWVKSAKKKITEKEWDAIVESVCDRR